MKTCFRLIAAAVLMTASQLNAADSVSLDDLAGVYKHTVESADASGNPLQEEEILEIVKISELTAYFRTYVTGPNGHMCTLWGVATLSGDALSYRHKDDESACNFAIQVRGENLVLGDENGECRVGHCGSRAGFSGSEFALKSRRPIRYMQTLLNSKQYREAVEEHRAARK